MKKVSNLAHNIRYLRKNLGWSQEALANKIGVKRSNIAAYEAKNVEPRLRVILKLSSIFGIPIHSLISEKINHEVNHLLIDNQKGRLGLDAEFFPGIKEFDLSHFIEEAKEIRKILDGFKAFYKFKMTNSSETSADRERLKSDIENFLQLMDHLSARNESIVQNLYDYQGSRVV